MDEPLPSLPEPERGPAPAAPPPSNGEHHAGARRVKRRIMFTMIALWVFSAGAACVLILRGSTPRADKEKSSDSARSLLAMAEKDSVGWISIHGPIMASEGGKPWARGVEQWSRRLKAMSEAKGVRAIILDINSPGGSVGAVQELHSQILRVRKEKKIPIIALFGDVAASGGYYIAAACDEIIAHPGTLTGSIGVIFSVSNLEGLFQKVGYKSDPIKSGKHKDIGSPARAMTKEEREILQSLIDDAYGQFVDAVAAGRKLPPETVRPLADGRIYSGRQALQNKLVDRLGDSTDAVERAAEMAGIKGRPKVKRDTERLSDIFDLLETRARLSFGLSALVETFSPSGPGLEYRWTGFAR